MKKYFLPIWVISALILFGCNNVTENPENNGSTTTQTDTTTNTGDDDNDFVENQTFSYVITVTWNGSNATISNDVDGVTVTSNNSGNVVIASTVKQVEYVLTGNGSGQFKIYSDYKLKLTLSDLALTNSSGVAISDQCHKTTYVVLEGNNTLTDGSGYSTTDSDGDDAKAAFFSEGQLIITGEGSLTINGNNKHALASDDYIRIREGEITLNGKAADGLHTNDGIIINGGSLTVSATNDAIQCDTSSIVISGGSVTITSAGDKGIIAYSNIEVSGGNINISSSDKAIKSQAGDIIITNGTFTLNTTGDDGKAILAKTGKVQITDGTFTITTKGSGAKGIKAQGDLIIDGGTFSITTPGGSSSQGGWGGGGNSSGAEGIESKSNLYINGGTLEIKAYDDVINTKGNLYINGGKVYAYSTNNDAIDSNSNIYINGGFVIAYSSTTPETAFDVDSPGQLYINGGYIMAIGLQSNMTPYPTSSSKQPTIFYNGSLSSTNYALNSSSANLITFKPELTGSYCVMLSHPNLTKGSSYTLYSGAITSADMWHGVALDATLSSNGNSVETVSSLSSPYSSIGSSSGGGWTGGGPGGGGRH